MKFVTFTVMSRSGKNRHLFDRYYVLMSDKDEASEKICDEFDSTPIKFDKFFGQKIRFNKSWGIRHAQNIVHEAHPDRWVVLLDTDIIVDEGLKDLDASGLRKDVLYGVRRHDAHSYEEYKDGRLRMHPSNNRSVVIGYFQMYFDKSKFYPPGSHNAATCDVKFASSFEHNGFLPNMKAIHIGKAKIHWNSRSRERPSWPG